jgi:hypothetical protein
MTSPNPHANSHKREIKRESVAKASIGYGWVTDQHPNTNQVKIQPIGRPQSVTANVSVSSDGDVSIPDRSGEQDLLAVYGRLDGEKPIVLGFFYDPELHEIPDSQAGERKVGHQASETELYFRADGSLEVTTDSNLILNGGTQGAIYDIETRTDSDGHVTSVTPQRRSDILI